MIGILDPVNEENWIGRQTFSIREIQEEWGLSFMALGVAMEEFSGDVNGGRGKSLLGSVVGLTTRYPTSLPPPSPSPSNGVFWGFWLSWARVNGE